MQCYRHFTYFNYIKVSDIFVHDLYTLKNWFEHFLFLDSEINMIKSWVLVLKVLITSDPSRTASTMLPIISIYAPLIMVIPEYKVVTVVLYGGNATV